MVRLGKKLLPLLAMGLMASFAYADIPCTETVSGAAGGDAGGTFANSSGGCVSSLATTQGTYYFASDDENIFNPFGYAPGGVPTDTSDGIMLSSIWAQDPASTWTQINGNVPGGGGTTNSNTWVLPATIPGCGAENEPTCEPAGRWVAANFVWDQSLVGTYTMLDSDGVTVSDLITLDNSAGGFAAITFQSDPIVPEPTSLGFLAAGAVVLVGALKRRKAAEAKNATL